MSLERVVDGVAVPERFAAMGLALSAQGFAVARSHADRMSFGDIQVLFSDGLLDVELLRERGAPFVYVGLSGERRLPIGVWQAWLDGSTVANLDTDFDEEADFVEMRLREVSDRVGSSEGVAQSLEALLASSVAPSDGLRPALWD